MPEDFPVLDEDNFDGSVIGWASNAKEAADVYNNYIESVYTEPSSLTGKDFRFRTEPVTYNPDINTRKEAEFIEEHGAWAPIG